MDFRFLCVFPAKGETNSRHARHTAHPSLDLFPSTYPSARPPMRCRLESLRGRKALAVPETTDERRR